MGPKRATARQGGRPSKYSIGARNKILTLIQRGRSQDEAAREAGVHPATLYRWMDRYPAFGADVREAALRRDRLKRSLLGNGHYRPSVPWRRDCPECGSALEVRTAVFRFWRCERWPYCGFASWRPPAPWNCPLCGETTFWSHSRKSIACETYWCRYRQYARSS